MKVKPLVTPFIFIFLTVLGIEVSSRLITNQPINTQWRVIHKNGLLGNIENGEAISSFYGNLKQKYAFGEFGNRISLNRQYNNEIKSKLLDKKYCKYLILGDSLSFGWFVPYEKIYPTILENYFNKKFGSKIIFINSSAGGWGLADYHAYIDIYKNKLDKLNLSGIIINVNFDDARRAKVSKLYEIKNNGRSISVNRTNKFYNSKIARIKRSLNNRFISPIYNFSQLHLNSARIFKNLFLIGSIEQDPYLLKKEWSLEGDVISDLVERDTTITVEDIAKVKKAYLDLFDSSNELAPLYLVHTGVLPLKSMTKTNKYFFSKKGEEFLIERGINFDFSTIGKNIILKDNDVIKYDGHPNESGHLKIAKNIISSNSKTSLDNFIQTTCK